MKLGEHWCIRLPRRGFEMGKKEESQNPGCLWQPVDSYLLLISIAWESGLNPPHTNIPSLHRRRWHSKLIKQCQKKKKNYTWEPQHQFFCQLPECQYFLGRHFHASFIPQLYSVPFYFCSPGRWWHCRWHVNYCKPIIHLTLHPHFSLSFFFFYLLTHK